MDEDCNNHLLYISEDINRKEQEIETFPECLL